MNIMKENDLNMIDLVITHLTHPWGPPWTLETLFDHFILTAFALDPLLLHSLLFLLLVKYSNLLFIDLAVGLDHTKNNNKYFTCWSFKVDLVLSR